MRITSILLTLSLTILPLAGCGREGPVSKSTPPTTRGDAPPSPNIGNTTATGKVTETMNTAGYTYVCVDTGSDKVWAAAPQVEVKVGDEVTIPQGTPMQNYHSKTLDRDFEVIYFVSGFLGPDGQSLSKEGLSKQGHMPAGHPPMGGSSAPAKVDVSGIAKAEGGKTIGELFAERADLSGKEVTVRGKVVKFTANIMGKNWLHIQDGSGDSAAKTNDLTVTTIGTVKQGDTVLVTGTLAVDRDFGSGYKYDLIIEEAKVTAE